MARVAEFIWLAAAITVPLVVNPWACNPFELPKMAWLQTLGLLGILVGSIYSLEAWASNRRSGWRGIISPLAWLALAFGVVMALATAFSVNPWLSLWGSYERQQGLRALVSYLVLFLLITVNLRSRVQLDRLARIIVWGSGPVVVYGLAQAAGLDPLAWRTDAASPVLSTLGRANFLASYLVLVIPLTIRQVWLSSRRWPYTVLMAGQVAVLLFTQARGAWVGLLMALLISGLVWARLTRNRRLGLLVVLLAVVIIGVVGLLNWPGGPLAALAQWPGLERLATLFQTETGSTAARLTIWRATLPLLANRPWLGYGPETMRPIFVAVFPPQLVYYQGRHVTVDRAHNLWLDLGMSAGLMGLLAFGALLAGWGHLAWRGWRTAAGRWQQVTWGALVAAVAGHLADMQFSFDLTAGDTLFWLLLGMSAAMSRRLDTFTSETVTFPKPTTLLPYLPPLLATLVLSGVIGGRPLLADVACWQAQQTTRPLSERLTFAQRAVQFWTLEPEYHLQLVWIYLQLGQFAAGETELTAAQALQAHDPHLWAAQGEFYMGWGQVESKRYRQAEAAYRQALTLAPNIAAYHTSLGLALAQQGRLAEGLAELQRAVDLDATDAAAYRHLANLYRAVGQTARADEALHQALRWEKEQKGQ